MAKKFPRTLELPSNLERVEEAAYFAEEAAKDLHFSESEIDDIAIAMTEAVSNAMIHGNKKNAHKKVRIEIFQKTDRMIITVMDEGKGFDPHKVADPLQPENLLKESGRGIFILRSLMDRVDFSSDGYGTKTTLVKFRKITKKH